MVIPRRFLNGLVKRLGDFGAAAGGAVAIYVAFSGVALIGALVLALDVGRLAVVRSQMQNAADAACLSAAIQLDGQSGATTRADAVARNATAPTSDFNVTSGTNAITIGTLTNGIVFYTDTTLATTTTVDASALAMRVTLVSRPVALLLQPALALLSSASARSFSNVGATAVCAAATIICNPPSFMVCNAPLATPPIDLASVSSAGIQIQLRQPGGPNDPIAPGNFSLVCPFGNCGANAIRLALAGLGNAGCTDTFITTSPGIQALQVNRGINSRFDMPNVPNPAENIVAYPRDTTFISNYVGNGVWGRDAYWIAAHGDDSGPASHNSTIHSSDVPDAVPAGLEFYTRYQMYLYELGVKFARNDNFGKCDSNGTADCRTIYPIPTGGLEANDVTDGFVVVTPDDPDPYTGDGDDGDIPANNVTMPVPFPADPKRRVFRVAVVGDCSTAENGGQITGSADIDIEEFDLVEMFVTEPAGDPGDFFIFLEVMQKIGTVDSTDLIANAKLIE